MAGFKWKQLQINFLTEGYFNYSHLHHTYSTISSMWICMSFVMKKVESQFQHQILTQFIPEEFPLYHDLLLYGNSFAEKGERTYNSIASHELHGLWDVRFKFLEGGFIYTEWINNGKESNYCLFLLMLCLHLVCMVIAFFYF